MSANLKNFGVRLSNVVRPIYNGDKHPTVFANDALGGLHVVRSLSEFEKCQQRLLIGMEVVSLDETTLRDDNGNIVTSGSGGLPEIGRWRLIDATISCNAAKFNCPLLKQYGSNKKCLLEHPNCRISSITNCKWKRLYDDKQVGQSVDWREILNIPQIIKWIELDLSLPYLKFDQIIINNNQGNNNNLFSDDGKINPIFLRDGGQGSNTIFWNERILIDHSFYKANEWTKTIPASVLNKNVLEIGNLVEQVNIALMYNLENVLFPSKGSSHLRFFRLNNSKITQFDARNVNDTLEELNLDDNEYLEEIWISDNDIYKQSMIKKYPLKNISIRNCPNLKKIHITDTQVSTINLSGCNRISRLFADNTPMVNIIPQENYIDGTSRETYPVYEECIHYFFRNSPITKIGYESIYRSLVPAHKDFVICLHEGNNKHATESDTSIATNLGHLVSFDEKQTF